MVAIGAVDFDKRTKEAARRIRDTAISRNLIGAERETFVQRELGFLPRAQRPVVLGLLKSSVSTPGGVGFAEPRTGRGGTPQTERAVVIERTADGGEVFGRASERTPEIQQEARTQQLARQGFSETQISTKLALERERPQAEARAALRRGVTVSTGTARDIIEAERSARITSTSAKISFLGRAEETFAKQREFEARAFEFKGPEVQTVSPQIPGVSFTTFGTKQGTVVPQEVQPVAVLPEQTVGVREFKPGFFAGRRIDLEKELFALERERKTTSNLFRRGQIAGRTFGIGVEKSLLSGAEFTTSLVTRPGETITVLGAGGIEVGRRIFTGEGFPELGKTIRERPITSLGVVAGEVATAQIFGQTIKGAAKLTRQVRTITSPKFAPVKEGIVKVRSSVPGREFVEIKIAGPISTDLAEPLKQQAKIAGQTVDAVSGQRGLFRPFVGELVVEKPIPPGITGPSAQLERAFFADPRGRLRPSRLGILDDAPKASILDIVSGDVKIGREIPQAVIFEQVKVADLPADIGKTLAVGRPLSPAQQTRLLRFQLTPSGQFKPIGFLSVEPEITLAPGEIIKKGPVVGKTIIKGETVPIIRAEVGRATPKTAELLAKPVLSLTERGSLVSRLTVETGFDVSSIITTSPRISRSAIVGAGISAAGIIRRTKPSTKILSVSNVVKEISTPVRAFGLSSREILSRGPSFSPSPDFSKISGISRTPSASPISRAVSGGVSRPSPSGISIPPSIISPPPRRPPSAPPSIISPPPRLPPRRPPRVVLPPRAPPFLRLPKIRTRVKPTRLTRGLTRSSRFQPSVVAKAFKITAPTKKLKKLKLTGFEVRPIPVG